MTSTKNDYVVALWIVCAVALELLRSRWSWPCETGLGLALGLAALTKGTAMILAVPLVLIVGGVLLWRLRLAALARGIPIAALGLALCAGHFVRNLSLHCSPLGSVTADVRNPELSLRVMTSTALRNVAINPPHHANLPMLRTIAERGRDLLGLLHSFTGIDPVDPHFAWTADNPFAAGHSFDEDYTGNLVHTLLIVAALLIGVVRAARRRQFLLLGIMGGLVVAFLLFSLLLRWQIWANRLMLPLLVLWCALVVIALDDARGRRMALMAIAVALLRLPWVFNNATRPIDGRALYATLPREQHYFIKRPSLFEEYRDAAKGIIAIGCQRVGLLSGSNSWEYPLWVMLRNRGFEGTITHETVRNISATLAVRSERPCAMFADGGIGPVDGYADMPGVGTTLLVRRDTMALPRAREPGIITDQDLNVYLISG